MPYFVKENFVKYLMIHLGYFDEKNNVLSEKTKVTIKRNRKSSVVRMVRHFLYYNFKDEKLLKPSNVVISTLYNKLGFIIYTSYFK